MLVNADVSESSEVERMAAQTGEAFGSIDMLVAGAAIGYIRSHAEITYKTYRRTMAVNLDGTERSSQVCDG